MQDNRLARNEALLHEIQSLTPEEQLAFKSCMGKEAVFNGAIPFALTCSATGFLSMSISPFKKYAKHVAIFGGIFGYVVGKGLYGLTCLQKSVPRIRPLLEANQGVSQSVEQHDGNQQSSDMFLPQYTDQFDSVIDFGEPISSFDSYTSPDDSSDSLPTVETDLMESHNTQRSVTYNELRLKNRAGYRLTTPSVSGDRPVIVKRVKENDPVDVVTPPAQKTKYGDVWG